MLFFKSKKRVSTEEVAKKLAAKSDEARAELKEELEAAVVPAMEKAEGLVKSAAAAPAEKVQTVEETAAAAAENGERTMEVKLFPGVEDQPFEIGYANFASEEFGIADETPMLVMRWKEGKGAWFPLPQMFNKVVLDCLHSRETSLDTMLADYGYQVAENEAADRPSDADAK